MKSLHLRIRLLSDAVFSRTPATLGRPESLDYVPGATLLGVAASRCWASLSGDAARAFELGAVRFGDGRPVHRGVAALPTPLSWHTTKRPEGPIEGKKGYVLAYDLSRVAAPTEQLTQQRSGWWGRERESGARGPAAAPQEGWRGVWVPRVNSMRTAIAEGGRAREGLLFGFEAVSAGCVFEAEIQGEDALVDRVAGALVGVVHLGRSRSAEFGEALVERVEAVSPALLDAPAAPGSLRFLCVSDLALRDAWTGVPRVWPEPGDFGLPADWSLDLDRTFLRTRRYSPFNAHRRRPDLERQVIVAGSVLTFRSDAPGVALDRARAAVAGGVGEYRSRGLGAVLCEPAILGEDRPRLLDAVDTGSPERAAEVTPGVALALKADALFQWLGRVEAERERLDRTWVSAEAFAKEAAQWGVPRAQWGRVRAIAAEARLRQRPTEGRTALDRLVGEGVSADTWKHRGAALRKAFDEWSRQTDIDEWRALEIVGRRVPRHLVNEEVHRG